MQTQSVPILGFLVQTLLAFFVSLLLALADPDAVHPLEAHVEAQVVGQGAEHSANRVRVVVVPASCGGAVSNDRPYRASSTEPYSLLCVYRKLKPGRNDGEPADQPTSPLAIRVGRMQTMQRKNADRGKQ